MNSISILGCGWLGLPVGKYLAQNGFEVKGSTTQPSKIPIISEAGIQPYQLKFEPELVGNPGDFFDSDILMINIPPRNKEGMPDYHESQLKAIRKQARRKIKHLLFISSTGVYPTENQEVSEEGADAKCLSRGGISLLKMEQIFSGHQDFIATVIRLGGLYGPGRHPGRFLAGKKNLPGGKNPVNMIHLDDCIGIVEKIIEKKVWGETLNACSPSKENRKSFYENEAKNLGMAVPTFSKEPAPYKKVNAEKLIRLTGYEFKY